MTAKSFSECLAEINKRSEPIAHFLRKVLDDVDAGGDRVVIRKRDGAEESAADELDELAKAHAEKRGVSVAKAYDEVLQTDAGARLYAASLAARRLGDAPARVAAVQKAAVAMSDQVDALYTELANTIRKSGETFEAAYARAMQERPELYNDLAIMKRAVGA